MTAPQVLSTLEEKVAPIHTALLIIDMTNDFIHPEGKTATRAGRNVDAAWGVVPKMQALIQAARDAGVLTVFVKHTTLPYHQSDSGPWLDARSRATYSVTDLCLEGTWGQDFVEELKPQDGDVIIKKYRYSGFAGTNLDLVLRSHRISTIVCAGVSTNVCVESTAREGFSLDYYVILPEDACASWDMELHDASLETARHRYAVVCSSSELISVWKSETQ